MEQSFKQFSSLYFVCFLVTVVASREPIQRNGFASHQARIDFQAAQRQPASSLKSVCVSAIENFLQSKTFADDSAEAISTIVKANVKAVKALETRFRTRKGYSLLSPFNKLRDWSRYKLQRLHGHPYPIMAIDEAPRAYAWGKYIFNQLDEESMALLEIEKIADELIAATVQVKSFNEDIQILADRATNLAIQKQIFQNEVSKHKQMPFGIKVRHPILVRNAQGKMEEKMTESYFGSIVQFELEIQKISSELFGLQKVANDRGFEQAILIKKLETFRHEAIRHSTINGKAPPDNFKAIIDDITSLYENESAKRIHSDYSPPSWVWDLLKWRQLGYELKSILVKDFPRIKDETKLGNYLKFVTTKLDDNEKRILGLQNIGQLVGWYKNTKWARLIIALGTPSAAGAVAGGDKAKEYTVSIWNFLWEDKKRREECATKESSEDFAKCSIEFLQQRFPKKIFDAEHAKIDLITMKLEITDEKVQREFDKIMIRRNKFLMETKAKEQFSTLASQALKLLDRSSDEYRENLLEEKDEQKFQERLLSNNHNVGYLIYKHFSMYRRGEVQSLVNSIVKAKNAEARDALVKALKELKEGDKELEALAADLEQILKERSELLKAQEQNKEADKAIDSTIEKSIEKVPEETTGSSDEGAIVPPPL